ncbi:MAG: hypothetical protein INH41_00840 [Myxococcaceae bacterium]|jgi:hypothetical protein|nr:hypothetical protein [Myxococcaceae bacterium]MCA3010924.1 hypothetical protein [Myxococcaceae bacterium]
MVSSAAGEAMPGGGTPALPADGAGPGEALPLRGSLSAGGGLLVPTPASASGLLALDASVLVGARWRLGLLGAFSFGGSSAVTDEDGRTRGALSSTSLAVLGSALACTTGRLVACGGARAGVRVGLGVASGPFIFQPRTATTLAPTVGPAGRLALRFGRFFAAADVTLLVNLLTPALAVDGLFSAGSATPRLEALGWLGAGVEWP